RGKTYITGINRHTVPSRRLDAVLDVRLNDGRARISKSRQGRPNAASPRFQPWVASGKWPELRPPSRRSGALARREGGRGERKDGAGPVRSFVPDGTCFILAPQPSDESLGYFQASLRDLESRHAKRIHERETIYRSSANMAMGLFYAPETSKTQRQQSALSPR